MYQHIMDISGEEGKKGTEKIFKEMMVINIFFEKN